MKTKKDPRHQRRIQIVKLLFAHSFHEQQDKSDDLSSPVIKYIGALDEFIQRGAPQWPIEKISKIDLAILRMAVYELAIEKKEPPKVIIDEAVEIAKEFGNESSPKFINGVLGTVFVWIQKQ